MNNKLYVVGDKLKDFSSNKKIITISDLEKLIKDSRKKSYLKKYDIHIGQGISARRLNNLSVYLTNSGLNEVFRINMLSSYRKSTCNLTHKSKAKNIMISEPIQSNERTYESLLMIEEDCAEMSDHVTGQHIQGMVLVEAARQMVIAVTEKYFIADCYKGKIKFVTNSMETIFLNFVFPLSVSLEYQIIDIKRIHNANLSSKVLIKFIQNEKVVTEIIFKFSVFDARFIAEKETFLANQCIQSQLNDHSMV
ncbi:MAG: hypothetical protein JO149_05415 [Gammaproteobacteria bacterium]|nr:hypothetical protein [Gammaproteobacteria bacterium]